jgi:hypothetical protein
MRYTRRYAQIHAGQRYNHTADFSLTNSTLGKNIFKVFRWLNKDYFGMMDYEWMNAATATTAEEMELRMGNSVATVVLALTTGIMEPQHTKKQW